MALIKCPHCGGFTSDTENACPHCKKALTGENKTVISSQPKVEENSYENVSSARNIEETQPVYSNVNRDNAITQESSQNNKKAMYIIVAVIVMIFGIIVTIFWNDIMLNLSGGKEFYGTWEQYGYEQEGISYTNSRFDETFEWNKILQLTFRANGTGAISINGGLEVFEWKKNENGVYSNIDILTEDDNENNYNVKMEVKGDSLLLYVPYVEGTAIYYLAKEEDYDRVAASYEEAIATPVPTPAPTLAPTATPNYSYNNSSYYDDYDYDESYYGDDGYDYDESYYGDDGYDYDESYYGDDDYDYDESYYSSEYIFPDSDTVYLTKSDVKGMTADEINYAKNELYARYGRIFDREDLQEYFESLSWYEGRYTKEEWDEFGDAYFFNDIEIANRDFLVKQEQKAK